MGQMQTVSGLHGVDKEVKSKHAEHSAHVHCFQAGVTVMVVGRDMQCKEHNGQTNGALTNILNRTLYGFFALLFSCKVSSSPQIMLSIRVSFAATIF